MNAANNYFSVPRDILSDPRIETIEAMCGNGIKALAWWIGLLSLLYYYDGLIDLNKPGCKSMLLKKLEMADETELQTFLDACSGCDFISGELLTMGHVVSHGVCEQIEYHKAKSEVGKKGAKARWNGSKKDAK